MKKVNSLLSISALSAILSFSTHVSAAEYATSAAEVSVSAGTSKPEAEDRQIVEATLLSMTVKSYGKKRLYKVDFSSECDIRRFTVGTGLDKNNHSQLGVKALVWAEVDGQVIPISSDENPDSTGKISLCSQLEWDEASRGNRDDLKSATSFAWMATNISRGKHLLEIKSSLSAFAISGAEAGNAITLRLGKRMATFNQFR